MTDCHRNALIMRGGTRRGFTAGERETFRERNDAHRDRGADQEDPEGCPACGWPLYEFTAFHSLQLWRCSRCERAAVRRSEWLAVEDVAHEWTTDDMDRLARRFGEVPANGE